MYLRQERLVQGKVYAPREICCLVPRNLLPSSPMRATSTLEQTLVPSETRFASQLIVFDILSLPTCQKVDMQAIWCIQSLCWNQWKQKIVFWWFVAHCQAKSQNLSMLCSLQRTEGRYQTEGCTSLNIYNITEYRSMRDSCTLEKTWPMS